jgi:excisionase family DNA binding protein
MTTKIEQQMLSISETAKFLGLGRGMVYRMVLEGQIPSVKIGSKIYRIPKQWAIDKVAEAKAEVK